MHQIGQLIPEVLKTSQLTPELPTSSAWAPVFDAWHPSLAPAAAKVAEYVHAMASGGFPHWLTLSGLPGCGKTMFAKQIFREVKANINPGRHSLWVSGKDIHRDENRRPRCVWYTVRDFKDDMLGGQWDLPEYLRNDFLVVIDDLGATRDTKDNALADGLYRLADNRIGRWTVWTTNLSLAEIAVKIDARISSRLVRDDNRVITITAPDYALRPKPAPTA